MSERDIPEWIDESTDPTPQPLDLTRKQKAEVLFWVIVGVLLITFLVVTK